jgi:hypothetical protein
MSATRRGGDGVPAGERPQRADSGTGPVSVTLTVDHEARAGNAALAAVLRAHGGAVEIRTFLRTEEARGVVLLAVRRALPALLALVAPPTAPAGLSAALGEALFATAAPGTPAILQLKAQEAFVSLNAQNGTDLTRALGLLPTVVEQAEQQPLAQVAVAGERRFVYVEGVWQVYGVHEQPAFVFDATAHRLVTVR